MLPARQAEGPFDPDVFASLDERLDTAVSDLMWWSKALARAREEDPAG